MNLPVVIGVAIAAAIVSSSFSKKKKRAPSPFKSGTSCQELASDAKLQEWMDGPLTNATQAVAEEMESEFPLPPTPSSQGAMTEAYEDALDEYENNIMWFLLLFTERVLERSTGSCYDATTEAYTMIFRMVWAATAWWLASIGVLNEDAQMFISMAMDEGFDPRDPGTWPNEEGLEAHHEYGLSLGVQEAQSISEVPGMVRSLLPSRVVKRSNRVARKRSARAGHVSNRRARRGRIGG